jgi:small subunit ribosomal protein S10e
MLMPQKNRVAIYEYLFKEGVMVAKKDYHAPKHPALENIPNLQVIKAMQVQINLFFIKIYGPLKYLNQIINDIPS